MKRSLNQINPENKHQSQQGCLRGGGILLVIVGGIFALIGLGSFFSSFGSFEPPRYFWCAFVGLPMVGIGFSMLKFGYLGLFTRYVAKETAPPAKDTFNYLAEHTKEGVKTIAESIRGEATKPVQPVKTVEERLLKLQKLKENGLLNETEYNEQKQRILSDL